MDRDILELMRERPILRDFRESRQKKLPFDAFLYPKAVGLASRSPAILPKGISILTLSEADLRAEVTKMTITSTTELPAYPLQANSSVSVVVDEFPKFEELPTEIRLMIWNLALPGPRVVDIRLLPLKKTQSELDREQAKQLNSFSWDSYVSGADPEDLCFVEDDHEPDGKPPLVGVKSQCQNPSVFFVNKESHEVASKHYKMAFSSHASVPKTCINFEIDTIYMQYFNFNQLICTTESQRRETLIESLRKLDIEDLRKVKSIAIAPKPGSNRLSHDALADEIADLLSIFTEVVKVTIIADHHDGSGFRTIDRSPISFIEPIDVYDLFSSYWTSTIPDGLKMFDMPRPRTSKKLARVIISTDSFHEAIQRRRLAISEDTDDKNQNQIPTAMNEFPSVHVMVSITEAIKESPEMFLTSPALHNIRTNQPQFPEMAGIHRERPQDRLSGKTVRPGMYLHNFKDEVGPISSSYVEMSWVKYLELASAKFVEYAEESRKNGEPWWNA